MGPTSIDGARVQQSWEMSLEARHHASLTRPVPLLSAAIPLPPLPLPRRT